MRIEWLGDVVIGPQVKPLDAVAHLGLDRDHDHRHRRNLAQQAQRLEAVHLRHGNIHDHQVGQILTHAIERGEAVRGLDHLETLQLQVHPLQAADARLVINDQNAQFLTAGSRHG